MKKIIKGWIILNKGEPIQDKRLDGESIIIITKRMRFEQSWGLLGLEIKEVEIRIK